MKWLPTVGTLGLAMVLIVRPPAVAAIAAIALGVGIHRFVVEVRAPQAEKRGTT
jgi:hypothetical protein